MGSTTFQESDDNLSAFPGLTFMFDKSSGLLRFLSTTHTGSNKSLLDFKMRRLTSSLSVHIVISAVEASCEFNDNL